MVDLASSVSFIDDFVAQQSNAVSKAIFGSSNQAKRDAGGQATQSAQDRVTTPTVGTLSSNPIVNMGKDALNQAVTTMSQQLISTGSKKLESTVNKTLGIPVRQTLDDVMGGYYMVTGLAATASIEILMELARSNARLIVSTIKLKEAIIKVLQADITKIFNALTILLNSQPFFTDYYNKLVAAYNDILTADLDLKSIVSVLVASNHFNSQQYNAAVGLLQQAQALILPPGNASVSEISQVTSFIGAVQKDGLINAIKKKTEGDALAAALTIPGITADFSKNFLLYVAYTVAINELISLFLTVLPSFISTYQQNTNVNQTTINHINSATAQIDSLIADMQTVLFPTAAPLNPGLVTTSATAWGIRLSTIIQYLKINPGVASKELSITGESVTRYNAAVAQLQSQGDIKFGLATLSVTQSQEDVLATTQQTIKLLFVANTVIATQAVPANLIPNPPGVSAGPTNSIPSLFQQAQDYFTCVKTLDGFIQQALNPFINTPFELLNGAQAVVGQMTKLTKDLGLDRATSLLGKADIKGFYAMNAKTATFVGAAAVGVTGIIQAMKADPNTTDSELADVQAVSDDMSRQSDAKAVEATRSSSSTKDTFIANENQSLQQTQADAATAKQAAMKRDPSIAQSPTEVAAQQIGQVQGNQFNFGTLGTQSTQSTYTLGAGSTS